uniref:Uncharacterized protein n=1 Tax=Anguilla anguilla TaxID=7936 RepID=A0A0E9PE65_ANGAN
MVCFSLVLIPISIC